MSDGWIAVGDRLPEVGQTVIVATDEAFYGMAIDEYVGGQPRWDFYAPTLVTHWQPLPEPPRGKA